MILENKLKDICYPLTELDESSYKETIKVNNDSKYFYGGNLKD